MSSASGGFVPDSLTRGFAAGPRWRHSPHIPVVALHVSFRFVCGPSLQISCALLL